jgi:membrane-bound lytic murein transglycosylase MltF
MARSFVSRGLTLLVATSVVALGCAKKGSETASTTGTQATTESKGWTGDFDGMLERRNIRVLAPYSRSLYFVENGKAHGLTAELAQDFETYLNSKHASELGGKPITVTLVPTTRDKLLSELVAGTGDIAGGNLTATPSRMQTADFVAPTSQAPANEVLVSGPGAAPVMTTDDLSGKKVHVRKSSSYFESLNSLNDQLRVGNKPPVQIVPMPDALEDEDVLDMLNAGLFDYTIVDSWKAKLWAVTLPKIKVHDNVVLRTGGTIGWAIRKDSPKLHDELQGFYNVASKQGLIEARLANYRKALTEASKAHTGADRFGQTLTLFRKYGKRYPFDPLMLAAQGFTESDAGQTGAHDASAAAPKAAPVDGANLEKNVQAGTKYVDQMMAKYFPDAKFSETDKTLFTFASYKAGPEAIAQARTEAASRGLDPNQWFNNVELVAAEKLGTETAVYVRNIYKYDVASELIAEAGGGEK